ncbi:MAG: hypothetical protein BGN92_15285 [Sphingobacteriales bacterium 41-5]|nr:MAG: hypothetical protein BGN92_15285 [Sphingobacteriales bacterium 41-5]
MKKFTIIAVLLFYSLATFGVSLNYFYCCGKLKEVTINLNPPVAHKCLMKDGKDCCKNEKVELKVSADQQFSQQIVFEPLLFLKPALTNYFEISDRVESSVCFGWYQNKPPPGTNTSLNILQRNFRI